MRSRIAVVAGMAALALGCSSGGGVPDSGSCTPACGANASCTNGACVCSQNFTACPADGGSACVELPADDNNCGACGTVCPGTSTCLNGACACTLPSVQCGGTDGGVVCTDVSSDSQNCGGCGMPCAGAETCVADLCVCQSPYSTCTQADGGELCVDLGTDNANCGQCGTSCGATQQCAPSALGGPGSCQCKSGTEACDGGCVDINTDLANCGGCGQLCATGLCTGGACNCDDTDAGFKQCGRSCTDTLTDVHNCGGCANDCEQIAPGLPNVSCVAGGCACSNGAKSICTSPTLVCTDLTSDATHCGDCATSCSTPTSACVNGNCACPSGGELCGGTCEALTTDPNNCGTCFNSCASTFAQSASCHGGHCTCLDTQALCLNGVGGGPPDPLDPTCTCVTSGVGGCTQPTLKFDADVYPLLMQTTAPLGCAAAGCHAGAAAAGGLDFTSEASAWMGLVGGDGGLSTTTCDGGPTGAPGSIPSQACACVARVSPNNINQSLLIATLTNSNLCPVASPMPIDADGGFHSLSACEIQQISVWISQGALRN